MKSFSKISFIIVSSILFASCKQSSDTLTQWRGDHRSGIYIENGLLKTWPSEGPSLLWENEIIGNGYGSPIITNDRIFIQGEVDSIGYLFSFDLKGRLLWKTDYGKEWVVSYPGSRSAPTVVGDLIYVTSGLGNLYCFNYKDGTKNWSVDMLKDLNGRFTRFGHSESPLIDGDLVFLTPGGQDTNVIAFNRFTGKTVWVCKGLGYIPGYNSPNIIKLPARSILVTFTAYAFLGIDVKTGELLWSDEQDNIPVAERKPGMGDTHSNTAQYENGFIYYFAGDGKGAVKLKLSDDGSKIEQVWRIPDVFNYMGGIVKLGNYIYSTCNKDLRSIDATTGQFTDSLKIGEGVVLSADGMLYYYNQKGEVILVKAESGKLEQVSLFKITKGTHEHFAHPVIHDGVLYVRHGILLQAYKIK